MKKETLICDLCHKEPEKGTIRLNWQLQVIFTTEQTEGRSVKPYLEIVRLDVCYDCNDHIVKSKEYVVASGAMGQNNYTHSHIKQEEGD